MNTTQPKGMRHSHYLCSQLLALLKSVCITEKVQHICILMYVYTGQYKYTPLILREVQLFLYIIGYTIILLYLCYSIGTLQSLCRKSPFTVAPCPGTQ